MTLSVFFVITVVLLLMMKFKYTKAWPVLLVTVIWTVVALESDVGGFINQAVGTVIGIVQGVANNT